MIKQTDRVLAEAITSKGILPQKSIEECLSATQNSNDSLKTVLVSRGHLSEDQILTVLADTLQISVIDLKKEQIGQAVIDRVPVRFAWYFKFMPVKVVDKTITLATSNPMDIKLQDEIRTHLGLEPKLVLAKEADILDALNKYYGLAADTVERLSKETKTGTALEGESPGQVEDLEKQMDDASVTKLVNQILLEAYKKRATDIHIEPYRDKVRVRYRIDGVLVDANIPPAVKQFLLAIISRIKIMANLSIVEKRIPQDGSAVVKTKEKDLDLRISTIPTPRGESMVIRILPTDVRLMSLERLGLNPENVQTFRELVKKPHGIIFVTGPTGSGKTTTLYACLNEINSPNRKIITLEDPIESEMEGITQIQVNAKINLGFATGLRSILRHDPDIIMVGEVRDYETAEIAIRTALTGHLVFATLHTNDAASGITRLLDMGVEPFLVASSIEAFVAQRLVRIICSKCKEEVKSPLPEIKKEIAETMRIADAEKIKIYHGKGCDYCHQTGFYGRTAIYEILVIDEEIRTAILEKQRADSIKQLAMAKGLVTLRQDGLQRVLDGVTTPEEVLNVTVKDDHKLFGQQKKAEGAITKDPEGDARHVPKEVLAAKNEYDNRIYPRLNERVAIRYSIVKQDKDDPQRLVTERVEHASISKDISAGGIRFVSGYTLPLGTILSLKIQLEKNERSIDCLAKICRVEDDDLSAVFNLVVYYLDISSADRVKINNFVTEKMKKTDKAA